MATEINDMRLTGSKIDLSQWDILFKELASRELVTIVDISGLYPNRNSQLLYRQYYKLKFNGEIQNG